MSLILQDCIEYDKEQKICVAEEKGKKYCLQNESGFRIRKIKVDGCLAHDEGEKRCDYLFTIDTKQPKCAIFVELKGGDLNTALKQVYDSINYLKSELTAYELLVRIIGSRDVPQLKNSPAYQKLIRITSTKNFFYRTNRFYTEKI